jgi:uncharacterized protein DUF4136
MTANHMKMSMRHIVATGLWLLFSATMSIAWAKVQAQRDPKFDFTRLKTWSWNPSSPGQVKVWVSADSKSEPVQRQYEPIIMKAVEEQFAARGYPKATGATSDFHVTYYVLVTMGSSSQYAGQFLPTNAQWGIPLFAPNTTALTVYPQGALVLDAASPTPGDVVWRGLGEAKIEIEKQLTDAQRAARLTALIKDVVAKFPKKK